MGSVVKSITAGFGATLILSFFMIAKSALGVMPAMNAIALLVHLSHNLIGTPPSPVVGWILHFFIGSVLWGVLFGLLQSVLPGDRPVAKALCFSVVAWLLMMVILMPLAGQGLFAVKIGVMAAVATLVLHLIWGASLGLIYQWLQGAGDRTMESSRS